MHGDAFTRLLAMPVIHRLGERSTRCARSRATSAAATRAACTATTSASGTSTWSGSRCVVARVRRLDPRRPPRPGADRPWAGRSQSPVLVVSSRPLGPPDLGRRPDLRAPTSSSTSSGCADGRPQLSRHVTIAQVARAPCTTSRSPPSPRAPRCSTSSAAGSRRTSTGDRPASASLRPWIPSPASPSAASPSAPSPCSPPSLAAKLFLLDPTTNPQLPYMARHVRLARDRPRRAHPGLHRARPAAGWCSSGSRSTARTPSPASHGGDRRGLQEGRPAADRRRRRRRRHRGDGAAGVLSPRTSYEVAEAHRRRSLIV